MPGWDAHIHTDLIYRKAGSSDVLIGSADGAITENDSGIHFIHEVVAGAAVPASCGDQLVFRATYVSGSSNFLEFDVGLQIP